MALEKINLFRWVELKFHGVARFICTDCDNARFTIREDVTAMPYCPYCGNDQYTQLEGEKVHGSYSI